MTGSLVIDHSELLPSTSVVVALVLALRRCIVVRPIRPRRSGVVSTGVTGFESHGSHDSHDSHGSDGESSNAYRVTSARFWVRPILTIRVGAHSLAIPRWSPLIVGVAALVSPVLGLVLAILSAARVLAGPRKKGRQRQRDWAANVPDLVELVRLALGSGCTTHLSLLMIADHAGGPIGSMLQRTSRALREGSSTADALAELQERVGASVRPLCSALIGSERYGLPLAATLEALAVEARLARRRDAELRSRRLPVLLIFPLVVCILPAFALLTVVPLLGGGLSSLSW